MPIKLMISQLRLGNTGQEILQILDAITGDSEQQELVATYATPTMEEIDF